MEQFDAEALGTQFSQVHVLARTVATLRYPEKVHSKAFNLCMPTAEKVDRVSRAVSIGQAGQEVE